MSDEFPHLENLTDKEQAYLAEVQELVQREAVNQQDRCPASIPGKVTVKINNRVRFYFDSQEDADKWKRDNSGWGYLSGFLDGLLG